MYIPYDLISIVLFLLLGYGFGRLAEKRHYRSIIQREEQLEDIFVFTNKSPSPKWQISSSNLVYGNVVVSVDYFKRFLFALRNIFGGRVEAYETLLDRARREAVLRMKSQAKQLNANSIINVKFETAAISRGKNSSIGSMEVYAYGTAINFNDQSG